MQTKIASEGTFINFSNIEKKLLQNMSKLGKNQDKILGGLKV